MATDATVPRPMAARRGSAFGRWTLIAVVVLWFAMLVLVPTAAIASKAFADGPGPLIASLWRPEVANAFRLTLVTTAFATIANTVFGVAFAIVLVRQKFRGKALVDGLVDLPFAVSPVVAGLMLVVLYGPKGWLGRPLEAAGLQVAYAVPGMVLACMFVTLPFVVREVVPVLQEFGVDQEEVAYTLGAGRWTTFWRVTLPSIRWGLAYGVTLTVARSLGEFGALLVISGNTMNHTQTATLYVHDAIESTEPRGAYAASLVLAGTSFVLLVGMEWVRRRVAKREGKA
jgi:sulfate/thiosulfate transport system permease protein